MQVHGFRGQDRIFGFTEHAAAENLPARFGPWAPFKVLEMVRGQAMPGVNVEECLDDLEAHGFHITDAHVRITESALD
ncbi:MAG TPA: hypothetical protein VIJ94_03595 [Caulobacteraceae bacterium]